MRNCKTEILTALVAALKTALPTISVTTKKNWFEDDSNTAYPYIYIGEVNQTEDGAKNFFRYNVEMLIHVVYKDIIDLGAMYTTQNAVLGLIVPGKSLTLTNNFEIIETQLLSSNDIEVQVDAGILNVGLIRVRYDIWDKQ
jgi:hypothetical protein